MKTSIGNCARCGQNHHGLPVREFTRPPKRPHGYAWFAICPVTDEPLLLRIVAEKAPSDRPAAAPDANQPPDPPFHGSGRCARCQHVRALHLVGNPPGEDCRFETPAGGVCSCPAFVELPPIS